MPSIYKRESSPSGFKERLTVKAFKTRQAMNEFLNKQTNNNWNECVYPQIPTKSGVYVYAGGQYHNVKTLDSSILSHI